MFQAIIWEKHVVLYSDKYDVMQSKFSHFIGYNSDKIQIQSLTLILLTWRIW